MKIFNIFKRKKTVDDVFDSENGLLVKAGGFINDLHYSDAEKAQMSFERAKAYNDYYASSLSENTVRSKTRRDVATLVIKFYLLVLFMTGMTWKIDPEWSQIWFGIATTTGLVTLVLGVGSFFFGSHWLSKFQDKQKSKKDN